MKKKDKVYNEGYFKTNSIKRDASNNASKNASANEIQQEEIVVDTKKNYTARLPESLIEQLDDAIHVLKKTYRITRDTVALEAYTDWLDKYRSKGLIK